MAKDCRERHILRFPAGAATKYRGSSPGACEHFFVYRVNFPIVFSTPAPPSEAARATSGAPGRAPPIVPGWQRTARRKRMFVHIMFFSRCQAVILRHPFRAAPSTTRAHSGGVRQPFGDPQHDERLPRNAAQPGLPVAFRSGASTTQAGKSTLTRNDADCICSIYVQANDCQENCRGRRCVRRNERGVAADMR